MGKDNSILNIIDRLKSMLDFNRLKIVDNWPSDLCAIGLQRGNRLVYISTYNFIEKSEIKYDYDLEVIDKSDETKINVLKKGRGVNEVELAKELQAFLEV